MERKWPKVEYGNPFEFFLALITPTRIGPHLFEPSCMIYNNMIHMAHE